MTVLAPEHGSQGSSRKTTAKVTILLLLLGLLMWLGLIAAQYFQTGKPLSQIPGVPAPVASLLQEQPRYLGSIDGVTQPLGVAFGPNGTIYATEGGGERLVRAFDGAGTPVFAVSTSDPGFAPRKPAYVAVSPSGDMYATDLFFGKIKRFSPSGEFLGEVAAPFADGWMPEGVAFDRAGNLYVTDISPGSHRVVVLDPDGKLLRQFGKQGTALGEFSFPNTLAVDARGNIYVSDSGNGRVQVFDSDGGPLWTIGRGTGKGDFANPRGIAIDEARHILFVVDVINGSVNLYDISGSAPKFVVSFGGSGAGDPSSFAYPNGIALDGAGRAYVTDRENHRITVWGY